MNFDNETMFLTSYDTPTTLAPKIQFVYAGSGVSKMMIGMCVVMFVSMVINLAGNSLLLVAIRTTPSLWTKTNKILANLTIADLFAGLATVFYVAYSLKAYVFGVPCNYNLLEAAILPLFKLPPYASQYSMVIVAIDRYIAITHPLIYEDKLTDNVVYGMIAAVWIVSAVMSSTFWIWLVNRDRVRCTTVPNIVPGMFNWFEVSQNLLITVFVSVVYCHILRIAHKHHTQIRCELMSQPMSSTTRTTEATERETTTTIVMSSESQNVDGQSADKLKTNQQYEQKALHQQQQLNKTQQQRRREFKALYLTAVLVGAFVILWLPRKIGNVLQLAGVKQSFVADLLNIGGAFGMFNSSFNWILYGIVNKTYRKAFKRLLSM